MYWITSSRRWCSKSTSMSGGSFLSLEMKRSKSTDMRPGSTSDAEAVADGGIGRRSPALAENFLAAREGDDVLHREEERLVGELLDQLQLVLDGLDDGSRRALGIAARETGEGERPQVRGRRFS